jgi:hypothetical protein
MSNQSPRPETVLRRAIARALREASTAEPAIVESVDHATCTVDVQPLLMRVRQTESGEREVTRAPMVVGVPVLFAGGGGSRLTFPVKRGDVCLLLVATRSIARWNAIGGEVDPEDNRAHHISDSIALCGLTDSAHAKPFHATATVLEGNDVRLGDADNAQLLALKSDVDDLKSWAAGHFHAGGTIFGFTDTPSTPPPSATGTTNTKAS